MRRPPVAVLALLALVLAACSVPTDDAATPVATEDLPPELQPVVTEAPTTTAAPIGTDVPIFFYNTQTQLLQTVNRTVEEDDIVVGDALRQLFMATPTEEEFDSNLITRLVGDPDPDDPEAEPATLELVDVQSGSNQINIQIRGEILAQNPGRFQLFAQIVFTASDPALSGSAPNVLIQFANGANRPVATPAAEVRGRVSRADYPDLDPDNAEVPATTTTRPPPPSSTTARQRSNTPRDGTPADTTTTSG